jgi:hypothetical protein
MGVIPQNQKELPYASSHDTSPSGLRYNPPLSMYLRLIGVSTLLLLVSCTPNVPVPPPPVPPPNNVVPEWGHVTKTSGCAANGSLPDPACTPGNINQSLTKDVICAADFRTDTYRDKESTPTQKAATYMTYNIPHPENDTGANQQCELNHLISLEIGVSDDLSNIWSECSPGYSGWTGASFVTRFHDQPQTAHAFTIGPTNKRRHRLHRGCVRQSSNVRTSVFVPAGSRGFRAALRPRSKAAKVEGGLNAAPVYMRNWYKTSGSYAS